VDAEGIEWKRDLISDMVADWMCIRVSLLACELAYCMRMNLVIRVYLYLALYSSLLCTRTHPCLLSETWLLQSLAQLIFPPRESEASSYLGTFSYGFVVRGIYNIQCYWPCEAGGKSHSSCYAPVLLCHRLTALPCSRFARAFHLSFV
jgi:hypothetical protein